MIGAAGLAVGQAVLSKKTGAARVGGIGTSVANVISDFLSVTKPGLPPKTKTASLTATSSPLVPATPPATPLAPANSSSLRAATTAAVLGANATAAATLGAHAASITGR